MKIEGNMGVVFWALVGLLAGSAFGMVWHLTELTLVSTGGLAGAVIFGLNDFRSNRPNSPQDRVAPPVATTSGEVIP